MTISCIRLQRMRGAHPVAATTQCTMVVVVELRVVVSTGSADVVVLVTLSSATPSVLR